MAYIIYNDTEVKKPFSGRMPPANASYVRHYGNLLELQRACQVYEGVMKWQAEKELKICQDKLDWWSKRRDFNMQAVLPEIAKLKKMWGVQA